MTELVRYDAMCRAIDAAYAIDEVKIIHDHAKMLQAAARVAQNVDAETRAYEIRMRAARKANQIYDAGEKATGAKGQLAGRDSSGGPTIRPPERQAQTLEQLGISKQEMSEWRKLAAVPDEDFEAALATKTLPDVITKVTPVSGDALLFIGSMRDFERRGYLANTPEHFTATMIPEMLEEVYRIAPLAAAWLATIKRK